MGFAKSIHSDDENRERAMSILKRFIMGRQYLAKGEAVLDAGIAIQIVWEETDDVSITVNIWSSSFNVMPVYNSGPSWREEEPK